MGKTFESISRGLKEAVVHAKGKKIPVKKFKTNAMDVFALRQRIGMTQEQFAARFGFSLATLHIGSAETVRRVAHRWFC